MGASSAAAPHCCSGALLLVLGNMLPLVPGVGAGLKGPLLLEGPFHGRGDCGQGRLGKEGAGMKAQAELQAGSPQLCEWTAVQRSYAQE